MDGDGNSRSPLCPISAGNSRSLASPNLGQAKHGNKNVYHFSASYETSDFCWQIGLYFLQHLRPSHITETINTIVLCICQTLLLFLFSVLGFSEKKSKIYFQQPPPPIVVSKSPQFVPKSTICRFLAETGWTTHIFWSWLLLYIDTDTRARKHCLINHVTLL